MTTRALCHELANWGQAAFSWVEAKWSNDFESRAEIIANQDSTSSFANATREEWEREKKILMLEILRRKEKKKRRRKDYPLQNSIKKVFSHLADWPAACNTSWHSLDEQGGERLNKKKNQQKKTPTKRHKHLVQLGISFYTRPNGERSKSSRWLPCLFWMGPFIGFWSHNRLSRTVGTFQAGAAVIICAVACSSSVSAWRNSNTCRKTQRSNQRVEERGLGWSTREENTSTRLKLVC